MLMYLQFVTCFISIKQFELGLKLKRVFVKYGNEHFSNEHLVTTIYLPRRLQNKTVVFIKHSFWWQQILSWCSILTLNSCCIYFLSFGSNEHYSLKSTLRLFLFFVLICLDKRNYIKCFNINVDKKTSQCSF